MVRRSQSPRLKLNESESNKLIHRRKDLSLRLIIFNRRPEVALASFSMSRANRSHLVATMKSPVLMALLVVCLCEVGAALVTKESSVPFQATAGIKGLSGKVQQRQQSQQQQEIDHSRLIGRSQPKRPQGSLPLPSSSSTTSSSSIPLSTLIPSTRLGPFFRRQSEPLNAEAEKVSTTSDDATAAQSGFWLDNELTLSDDLTDDTSNGRPFNWQGAQLDRSQESEQPEIAALSTWQHRLRLHPEPSRVGAWHQQPPSLPTPDLQQLSGKSLFHGQQVLTPSNNPHPTYKEEGDASNPQNQPSARRTNQTGYEDTNDNLLLIPLWPKRSIDVKKSDRENRSKNNHKEKSETANAGMVAPTPTKGNKGKNSRKQQHQQQKQHQQQDSSHRQSLGGAAGVATSGTRKALPHEHSRVAAERVSSTPDVSRMNRNLASQFLLRSPRENRQYDVPIIGESPKIISAFCPGFYI